MRSSQRRTPHLIWNVLNLSTRTAALCLRKIRVANFSNNRNRFKSKALHWKYLFISLWMIVLYFLQSMISSVKLWIKNAKYLHTCILYLGHCFKIVTEMNSRVKRCIEYFLLYCQMVVLYFLDHSIQDQSLRTIRSVKLVFRPLFEVDEFKSKASIWKYC